MSTNKQRARHANDKADGIIDRIVNKPYGALKLLTVLVALFIAALVFFSSGDADAPGEPQQNSAVAVGMVPVSMTDAAKRDKRANVPPGALLIQVIEVYCIGGVAHLLGLDRSSSDNLRITRERCRYDPYRPVAESVTDT